METLLDSIQGYVTSFWDRPDVGSRLTVECRGRPKEEGLGNGA